MRTFFSPPSVAHSVQKQMQSVLDETPQTTAQWCGFMLRSIICAKEVQSLVLQDVLSRIEENTKQYQANLSTFSDLWKYKIHQEHLLIQLANCMPKSLPFPVNLIQPNGNISHYTLSRSPTLTPKCAYHYHNIHLVCDTGQYHLHLYAGSTPFAYVKATPWTLIADVWVDVGWLGVSISRTKRHLDFLKQYGSEPLHITCIGHSLGGSIARLQTFLLEQLDPECRRARYHYHAYSAPGRIYYSDTLMPWLSLALGLLVAHYAHATSAPIALGILTWATSVFLSSLWARKHLGGFPKCASVTLLQPVAHTRQQAPSTWTHLARFNVFSNTLTIETNSDTKKTWSYQSVEVNQRITYATTSKIESIIEFGHSSNLYQHDHWWIRHMWTVTYVYLLQGSLSIAGLLGVGGIWCADQTTVAISKSLSFFHNPTQYLRLAKEYKQ